MSNVDNRTQEERDEEQENLRNRVKFAIVVNGSSGSFRMFSTAGAERMVGRFREQRPSDEVCLVKIRYRTCTACGQSSDDWRTVSFKPCPVCRPQR